MSATRIGLLAGTEISFPDALEDFLEFLAPDLDAAGLPLALERVILGPFRTDAPAPYDILVDRIGHWHVFAREWVKAAVVHGAYPLNHPFAFQSMEKTTGYAAMRRLGLDVPPTWCIPPKDQSRLPPGVAERYHRGFSLLEVGAGLGFPVFLKPFDGGGWVGVTRADSPEALARDYDASGRRVMLAQAGIVGGKLIRCVGIGPQVLIFPYAPEQPLHERYRIDDPELGAAERAELQRITRLIGAFFGLAWNSVEVIVAGGRYYPIDFWNAVPDASLASLHYHFPASLVALVRWLAFCAGTARRFRFDTRIDRFFEAAARHPEGAARLAALDELVAVDLADEELAGFSASRLGFLEGRAREYFRLRRFDRILAREVFRTFPLHERDQFLEYYGSRIRRWADS